MSLAQRAVVLVGMICLIFSAIYVPWTYTNEYGGQAGDRPAGYAPIFTPAQPIKSRGEGGYYSTGVKVDVPRVVLTIVAIVLATIGGVVLVGRRK